MNDQALRDYFIFDESDLIANRNGRLSENQQKKMLKDDKDATKTVIGIGILFFVIASIYPFVQIIIPMALAVWQGNFIGKASGNLGTVIWVFIWGTLGCFSIYSGLANQKPKIILKKVEGSVHFVGMDGSSGGEIEYSLRIGKVKLEVVDQEITNVMKNGDIYAVYFYNLNDGTGNHILSLERLSSIFP